MNQLIFEIAELRRQNNSLWMKVLEIALDTAPERTKPILRKINDNDRAVSTLFGELSK